MRYHDMHWLRIDRYFISDEKDPDNLKVTGEPFTVEKYGVGLKKGDTALREFINKMFSDGGTVWQKIYDESLGKSGTSVEQPAVENY